MMRMSNLLILLSKLRLRIVGVGQIRGLLSFLLAKNERQRMKGLNQCATDLISSNPSWQHSHEAYFGRNATKSTACAG